MIRRIIDEEKQYRRNNNIIKRKTSPIEAWVLLLPVLFGLFAFIMMFYGLNKQATVPVKCISYDRFSDCPTSSIVIAVMVTDIAKLRTAVQTWIKHATGSLGMTVVLVGNSMQQSVLRSLGDGNGAEGDALSKLPFVTIYSVDDIDKSIEIWKWLYYHYGSTKRWLMKVPDSTFVHPYFLTQILCNRDPYLRWYIGENGRSVHIKMFRFAGTAAGYILSTSAANVLIQAWEDEYCTPLIAEDVSISRCMQMLDIPLTGYSQFYPSEPVHLFKSLTEFITIGGVNSDKMHQLAEKYFLPCPY